ncbi:acyl-CoA thioesterase [Govanella unica]|uniref:Acyl-CoA thioesterase n=1 Tax=Govanella unica TaxID=2975056 RepID=A0A9X3TYV4_9PROT|nr:thioesterase family protein [Govania unica]MDA5194496.1 acyl-CoA thioesterase [Govania unica]
MSREAFRYSYPLRVRYSEIDGQGIVYNAHYMTYCDIATTEYMRALGIALDVETARASGADVHLVKATFEWKAPALADQELDILVRTERIGRSSLTLVIEIHPRDEDSLLLRSEIVYVYTDQTTRRSTPLPEDWIARIQAFDGVMASS